MSDNEYGLDADYFSKNLKRICRDVDRYTPEEMHTALTRLSTVCGEDLLAKVEELQAVVDRLYREIKSLGDILRFKHTPYPPQLNDLENLAKQHTSEVK